MTGASFDTIVDLERSTLQRMARADPGVVHLGYQSGQLALYFDPPAAGVSRVTITAVGGSPEEDPAPFYHAIVHRVGRVGDDDRRQVFRHPGPALDWLLETVPDFDLLETVCVNEPEGAGSPPD